MSMNLDKMADERAAESSSGETQIFFKDEIEIEENKLFEDEESLRSSSIEKAENLHTSNRYDYVVTKSKVFIAHKESKLQLVRYRCDQCDYLAKSPKALKTHVTKVHITNKLQFYGYRYGYRCEQCGFMAKTPETLKMHATKVDHKKSKLQDVIFKCDQCDYVATASESLKQHKDSKHEEVCYPCNQCDYKASSFSYLQDHNGSMHENPLNLRGQQLNMDLEVTKNETVTIKEEIDNMEHKIILEDKHLDIAETSEQNSVFISEQNLDSESNVHVKQETLDPLLIEPKMNFGSVDSNISLVFKCGQCDFINTSILSVKQHQEESDHEGITHQCDLCEYQADPLNTSDDHRVKIHNVYHCNENKCSYVSLSLDDARRDAHVEKVHNKFQFDQCDYLAVPSAPLYTNVTEHEKKGLKGYPCKHCDFKAFSWDTLLEHRIKEHNGYYCNKCSYISQSLGDIKRHEKKEHMEYPCSYCDYKAASWDTLKEHRTKEHNVYHCNKDNCIYYSRSLVDIKRHESRKHMKDPGFRLSTELKKYHCNKCTYKSSSLVEVKIHEINEHIVYPCNKCDYKATSSADLKKHYNLHHSKHTINVT